MTPYSKLVWVPKVVDPVNPFITAVDIMSADDYSCYIIATLSNNVVQPMSLTREYILDNYDIGYE